MFNTSLQDNANDIFFQSRIRRKEKNYFKLEQGKFRLTKKTH